MPSNKSEYAKQHYQANKEKYNETSRLYYSENKEKIALWNKTYHLENKNIIEAQRQRSRQENPIRHMLYKTKQRAKEKGLEYNLTEDSFKELPIYCPVLNILLSYNNTKQAYDNSASIDRFDNTKGYTIGNVYIVSHRANTLKRDGTLEEFKNIVMYLEQKIVEVSV